MLVSWCLPGCNWRSAALHPQLLPELAADLVFSAVAGEILRLAWRLTAMKIVPFRRKWCTSECISESLFASREECETDWTKILSWEDSMLNTLLRGPKTLIGSATLVALSFGAPALAQEQLSIATGGTGGVYYPMGGGLAEIINAHVDGYSATAEVTGASVENMGLIATGDADVAIGLADTVYQAYSGTGRFEGQQLPMVRGLASLYANMVHIVTLEGSGISSLDDLRGKRVSVGAPGSGTEVNTAAILEANGITYDDIEEQRLNFNETADALGNGDIDAGFWSVGAPTSSILNLATTQDIAIIEMTAAQLEAAMGASATFAVTTLAGGTYNGVDDDVTVLGIPNVLTVSSEMSDDLAYAITSAMFENIAELRAVHPAANQTTVELTLSATPVPLHPGAIRYFEEIGADIPDRLRP
jgi:TRAP transporter TAXI family solute receptor